MKTDANRTVEGEAAGKAVIVLSTVPTKEVGIRIARTLVEARLAACVNMIESIRSIYRWQGTVEDEPEILLLIKTRLHLFESVSEQVKRLHPYEVPELIALPIESGNPEYMTWLTQSTG